jgi:hypothetical protein
MYIDQLIDTELNILLDWNFIKTIAAGSSKGRPPVWFKILKEKITTNNRYLLNNSPNTIPQINGSLKLYNNITKDKHIKKWCFFKDEYDQIQWGKIKEKGNPSKSLTTIFHYISTTSGPEHTTFTTCQDSNCNIGNTEPDNNLCKVIVKKKDILSSIKPELITDHYQYLLHATFIHWKGTHILKWLKK